VSLTATLVRRNLGPVSRIPAGEGRRFEIDGELIAVFVSRNGEIYATQASCPHKQGPLEDGILGGTTLICPFHGWKFNLESGRSLDGNCNLRTYPVVLDDNGDVILILSEQETRPV
jgi:nitrite reductase (NADH) small subunit